MQRECAFAKVNLDLRITGKRADGYHLLQSLVIFADFGDKIMARPAKDISLTISGPFAADLAAVDNLVTKAAQGLRQCLGIDQGALLHLEKNLPPASGLGGGSADAAAALRILLALWGKTASPESLAKLALDLGADVPVCLHQRPAIMRGIGEELQPVRSFPALPCVLVNPRIHVATPDVFRVLNWCAEKDGEPPSPPAEFATAAAVLSWLAETTNDLQAPAIRLTPQIGDVLSAIGTENGCRLARMSGSGATCFGLFDTQDHARNAALNLQNANPAWWVRAVETRPAG